MRKGLIIFGAFVLTLILAGHSGEMPAKEEQSGFQPQSIKSPSPTSSSSLRVDTDFGKMPLNFIPNKGQMDKQVAYYVQGKDKTIYFTNEGMTLVLTRADENEGESSFPGRSGLKFSAREEGLEDKDTVLTAGTESGSERWVVKLDFVGANPDVRPVGQEETGAIISYFKGKPEEWKTGLATYSKIVYRNLWPGIDLIYYGTVNRLKYEFIVHPGADPSKIRLAYRGADSVSVAEDGRLQVATPVGAFSDDVPAAYQQDGEERRGVSLAYRLNTGNEFEESQSDPEEKKERQRISYGFEVGEYDPLLSIVLDPAILLYCGYIGGSGDDRGNGIAVDGSGNAYVIGSTSSTDVSFPETVGPDLIHNGGSDAFVAKVSSSGVSLVYCGYIGGSGNDYAYGIDVDTAGNAYVTGSTNSTQADFPTTIGPDLTYNGGSFDAFIAKVGNTGGSLVYCGYIGGASSDEGKGIAVDGSGNSYISGITLSAESTFPVVAGPDLTYNGGDDAFVAKVFASGVALAYCGYIGGSGNDHSYGIAVDTSGNAYVTGDTNSTEASFPEAVGPDLSSNGDSDGYIAKVNTSGTALAYCGYIGGVDKDACRDIAVDASGTAFVTGDTYSSEATFPVTIGPDVTYNKYDAFVARINALGTALIYCGYIDSNNNYVDVGTGIAVDGSGNAHVAGYYWYVVVDYPYDPVYYWDAFVAKINASGTELVQYKVIKTDYDNEYGRGIAVDGSRNAYVTGETESGYGAFPVTVGPDLTYNGGTYDAFVAKVYYFEQPVHRHAIGDYDGDGSDEVAMDFGSGGAWMWNGGIWSQLTISNPENMISIDIDGSGDDELAVDLDLNGVWIWNQGTWSQIYANNPEYMIAADTNGNGIEELIIDLGDWGLKWRQEDGSIFGMTGVNPQNIIAVDTDHDGGDEVVVDVGTMGMWVCDAGNWSQLTSADPNTMAGTDAQGFGNEGVATGLGGLGGWLWDSGAWSQLSGVYSDQLLSGKMLLGGGEEIAGDFGQLGLWLWSSNAWSQLSNINADDVIAADIDGNGIDEVVGDFGYLGLWIWGSGNWSHLTGVNPERLLAGDIDDDDAQELIVDFGTLGVWMWNGGTWSQISSLNPD